jgi:hypothetical protein
MVEPLNIQTSTKRINVASISRINCILDEHAINKK